MKKTTIMMVAVAGLLMFANASMASLTNYVFTGSNNPVNVESPGTLNGTFALDFTGAGTVGLTTLANDFSFTMNHTEGAGFVQTFDNTNTTIYTFDVTLDASGDVTSLLFDGDNSDPGVAFMEVKFDLGQSPNRADPGSSSQILNYDNGGTGRVFLDNVTVTQVAGIPEPGSLALLGLSGLALISRRRRA